MDPLSILTGVLGALTSLTTLSMRINDLRHAVQEASTDLQLLTQEVTALTLILKQLEEAKRQGKLARTLTRDLDKVLQGLNKSAIETELFLSGIQTRKLKGVYWAFTGKTQCVQFSRRLESYKSTLVLTLTLSNV
jgi:hypothetical protein